MVISSQRKPSPLARGTVALTMVALAAIVSPRLLLQAQDEPLSSGVAYTSQIIALIGLAIVYVAVYWAAQIVPRSSSQKVVSTYLGIGAGIVVSAAQFIAFTVLAVQGAALAGESVDSIVALGQWKQLVVILVLIVSALPALLRWNIPWRVFLGAALVGVVALTIVLIGSLVLELTGGSSEFLSGSGASEPFTLENENWRVVLRTVMAASFPAALLVLVSERPMKTSEYRRVSPESLAKALVPAIVMMSLTLYLVLATGMNDHEQTLPGVYFAGLAAGQIAQVVVALAFVATGWAASSIGFWCLPRLVKELAMDHVLPRHLASDDVVRARVTIVLGTLAVGCALSGYLGFSVAGVMIFVFMMAVIFLLFCMAMAFRGHAILQQSMDRAERTGARTSMWVFSGFAVFGAAAIVGIAVAGYQWALVGLLLLVVPSALLVFFRRGRIRVGARLAARDLTRGRTLPTRVHGVVLVNQLDTPALRALTFARAARLTTLTAVTVDFDAEATKRLREAWKEAAIPVNLTVLGTPQGASTTNIVEYVRSLRALRPADIVMVYAPRVISTGMGQRFFVRHSTPRIISALRTEQGVVICEVPFVLSAESEEG